MGNAQDTPIALCVRHTNWHCSGGLCIVQPDCVRPPMDEWQNKEGVVFSSSPSGFLPASADLLLCFSWTVFYALSAEKFKLDLILCHKWLIFWINLRFWGSGTAFQTCKQTITKSTRLTACNSSHTNPLTLPIHLSNFDVRFKNDFTTT